MTYCASGATSGSSGASGVDSSPGPYLGFLNLQAGKKTRGLGI